MADKSIHRIAPDITDSCGPRRWRWLAPNWKTGRGDLLLRCATTWPKGRRVCLLASAAGAGRRDAADADAASTEVQGFRRHSVAPSESRVIMSEEPVARRASCNRFEILAPSVRRRAGNCNPKITPRNIISAKRCISRNLALLSPLCCCIIQEISTSWFRIDVPKGPW